MLKEITTEHGTLFLSDDLRLVRKLQAEGKKAAVILTEENRNEDFSGFPYALEKPEEMGQADYERLYRRLAGLPWDIMETRRCRLREMTVDDVDRLYEMYEDTSVTRFLEELYEDREEERKYTEDYCNYIYGFYGYGIWVIEDKESGKIIGRAGIEPREDGVELGYMVAGDWQGQGIAYEACQAVLEYAKEEVGWENVISRVQPANKASLGLLKKLGFQLMSPEPDEKGLLTFILPAV